jgi:hypothetical protein
MLDQHVLAVQVAGGWSSPWRLLWRTAANSGSCEGRRTDFYRQACLGERVTSVIVQWAAAWATAVQRRANGRWRCGHPAHAGAARGTDPGPKVLRTGAPWNHGQTRGRRSASACVYDAVRRQADRPCTTSRGRGVPARSGAKHFSLALFNCILLQFFQQK